MFSNNIFILRIKNICPQQDTAVMCAGHRFQHLFVPFFMFKNLCIHQLYNIKQEINIGF